MTDPTSLWQSIQKMQARAVQAQQGARSARLERYMPGANRLTKAITAAILAGQGLLDGRPASRHARAHGRPREGYDEVERTRGPS